MDIANLKKLLPILQKHRVKLYKTHEIELELDVYGQKGGESPSESTTETKEAPHSQGDPDLKADELMDYDKILNWSGTPDSAEEPLPLTGETKEVNS